MKSSQKQIFRHKLTGGKMLLKTKGDTVSTFYHLDENNEKIRDTEIVSKHPAIDIHGNPAYKIAVCHNDNLEPIK